MFKSIRTLSVLAASAFSLRAVAAPAPLPCALPEYTYLLELTTIQAPEVSAYTAAQVAHLDDRLQAQIVKATRSANLAEAVEAIENSEDREIFVRTFTSASLPSAYYTLITYYPGGNEYGAIFTMKSTRASAVVQDGEINECKILAQSVERELKNVPYVDGFDASLPYKGFDELTLVSTYGEISDAALVYARASRTTAPGLDSLRIKQLAKARRAIQHFSPAYGDAITAGKYLEDADTSWSLHVATDADTKVTYDVVRFNESDDGSHTVVFEQDSTRIAYVYYEN